MNRLMNSGLMHPSSSKASALMGGKIGASLAGASALGEDVSVTFPVISVHCVGGVTLALPIGGVGTIVRMFSSVGFGSEAAGVGGGMAGEAFFLVATVFAFNGTPFFILQG